MTSTSTQSPHTKACRDASAFHYLSDVASWMTTHTQETSTRNLRIPPAVATSSNSTNVPLTQLGLLTNSKSRLFCVGDQAEFVGIRGLIPLVISSSPSGRISTVTVFKGREGVKGRRVASISWYTAMLKPLPLRSSTLAFERAHAFTSSRD